MSQAQATIVLRSDIAELPRLASALGEFAAANALPRDTANDLALALEEVVTNVIVHGYERRDAHTVRVRLLARPGEVNAEVEDDAPAYDPLARPTPELHRPVEDRPIGGLGIHLVRSLMDTVSYCRDGKCNRLTLTKRWPTPARS
jgi:anti-sigma regulatory factor (Ser/Thr protein kinase)